MITTFKISVSICILFLLPLILFAQNDVTQFLGIPVDGYKPEMIKKLQEKGFTVNPYANDVLDGEFKGIKVNIIIATNDNKVWRIAVTDANAISETDIRFRFNNLLQQFHNNSKYLPDPYYIRSQKSLMRIKLNFNIQITKRQVR